MSGVTLLALLALVAVVAVSLPLLREPASADRIVELDPAVRERLALREARDDALAALSELEFDRRTGKVSNDDYRTSAAELRARVAAVLERLDGPLPTAPAERPVRDEQLHGG